MKRHLNKKIKKVIIAGSVVYVVCGIFMTGFRWGQDHVINNMQVHDYESQNGTYYVEYDGQVFSYEWENQNLQEIAKNLIENKSYSEICIKRQNGNIAFCGSPKMVVDNQWDSVVTKKVQAEDDENCLVVFVKDF